jgi:nicotinate dehydrogenase subunit B
MNEHLTFPRRALLTGAGAICLSFAIPNDLIAQTNKKLPGNLKKNNKLDSWIRVSRDGRITLLIGKVELGQGTVTAAGQIAADELQVNFDRIDIISGDTFDGPDEGTTAGSGSAPGCFPAVHQAAAEVRQILMQMASSKLNTPTTQMSLNDGTISAGQKSITYWELVDGLNLSIEATGQAERISPSLHKYIGKSVPRIDIPAKVTGKPIFVQEMFPEGVVYGAIARPPTYDAQLVSADLGAAEKMAGVIKVVRNGSLLGVIAKSQEQAWAAAKHLTNTSKWDIKKSLPTHEGIYKWLEDYKSKEKVIFEQGSQDVSSSKTLEATYYRPYQMHGSIGPSAAIATYDKDGILTVHTHTQQPFGDASAVAEFLGLDKTKVRVIHTHGAGCYGHNMADDAAIDAAWLAYHIQGQPLKLQYSREEEHRFEPYGSAMLIKTRARVDSAGNVLAWNNEIWSTPHSTRPSGKAKRALSAQYTNPPMKMDERKDGGPPNYAAARNGIPLYEFKNKRVSTHFVPEMPIRVSAHRGLGAYANAFAIEAFMNELAFEANIDPVEYRLRYLQDPRARDVLTKTAELFGWNKWKASKNKGRGIAFAQYKNLQAYCAVALEAQVARRNGKVRVTRVVAVADCGHIVAPDNVKNQIEGGIIQSLSWTLMEEVKFDDTSILSSDWSSYPILTFSETPPVEVELINRPGKPYLGTAEASQEQVAPALAAAIREACGAKMRQIPFTPERVLASI